MVIFGQRYLRPLLNDPSTPHSKRSEHYPATDPRRLINE